MPTTTTVSVTYDPEKRSFTIDPDPVIVSDGDQVWWQFSGVPDGWFGLIKFDSRFGPFHSLRSFSGASVLAKGNVGSAASNNYSYRAGVIDPNPQEGTAVFSNPATVTNNAQYADTSPDIAVLYDGTQTPPALQVVPGTVSLNSGDTATWLIQGLPQNAVAVFWFEPTPGYMDPASGPFTDFIVSLGSGTTSVRACGLGFATDPGTAPATITYHIRVIDENGATLASGDPVIDNIGPPIPTGGG